MDEAERCHRIHYISYGKLIASGTVDDVVENAGLFTMLVSGGDLSTAQKRLRETDGVDQVAPFGVTLHVVGTDRDRLEAAVRQVCEETGSRRSTGETSLEDVFIQFMANARDNMA